MIQEPLDDPLGQHAFVVVRSAQTPFIEIVLLTSNALIVLGVWWVAWEFWRESGLGFASFTLVLFLTLLTAVPAYYLWQWRQASLVYQRTRSVHLFKPLKGHQASFFARMALLFWCVYFLMVGVAWFMISGSNRYLLGWYLLLALPGLVLGPFQYLYMRKLEKLTAQVLLLSSV